MYWLASYLDLGTVKSRDVDNAKGEKERDKETKILSLPLSYLARDSVLRQPHKRLHFRGDRALAPCALQRQ